MKIVYEDLEWEVTPRIEYARCNCGAVSNHEIQTWPGDFSNKPFTPDPTNELHYMCYDCKEAYDEQMQAFDSQDDKYGWTNDDLLEETEESLPLNLTDEELMNELSMEQDPDVDW